MTFWWFLSAFPDARDAVATMKEIDGHAVSFDLSRRKGRRRKTTGEGARRGVASEERMIGRRRKTGEEARRRVVME